MLWGLAGPDRWGACKRTVKSAVDRRLDHAFGDPFLPDVVMCTSEKCRALRRRVAIVRKRGGKTCMQQARALLLTDTDLHSNVRVSACAIAGGAGGRN